MSRFNGSQIVPSRGENEEELCSDLKKYSPILLLSSDRDTPLTNRIRWMCYCVTFETRFRSRIA
jgi:hypothetical protein